MVCKIGVKFHSLAWEYPIFPIQFIEEIIFAYCVFLAPLSNINRPYHSSVGKESDYCNAGEPGMIPGSGRSPGEENGNPLQYSFLENPMARGAWRATVHGVTESDMTEYTHTHTTGWSSLSWLIQRVNLRCQKEHIREAQVVSGRPMYQRSWYVVISGMISWSQFSPLQV